MFLVVNFIKHHSSLVQTIFQTNSFFEQISNMIIQLYFLDGIQPYVNNRIENFDFLCFDAEEWSIYI